MAFDLIPRRHQYGFLKSIDRGDLQTFEVQYPLSLVAGMHV
jgi:hypothetical protein